MNDLIGKTVQCVEYRDRHDEGILIVFTDGTKLVVRSMGMASEISVLVDNQVMTPKN